MRITIVCVGKVKEKYFTGAIDEYSKRLSRYCKLEIVEEYASDVFAQTEVNRCVYTDNVIYMLGGSSLIDSREYK